MAQLRLRLNNMCSKGKGVHNSCTCECEICGLGPTSNAHLQTFEGVTPLWQSILCVKRFLREKVYIGLHFQ